LASQGKIGSSPTHSGGTSQLVKMEICAQGHIGGVVGILVGEIERTPGLDVAQRAMDPLRDLMEDALQLLALEPCGRRIEQVRVCGVGRSILVS
jgi:hypothetical protein